MTCTYMHCCTATNCMHYALGASKFLGSKSTARNDVKTEMGLHILGIFRVWVPYCVHRLDIWLVTLYIANCVDSLHIGSAG